MTLGTNVDQTSDANKAVKSPHSGLEHAGQSDFSASPGGRDALTLALSQLELPCSDLV